MTGATGHMGWAGFNEIYKTGKYNISVLVRDSKKNRKKLSRYLDDPTVRIIWGDMLVYEDVLEGVTGADYVLHVGGMVSPAADYFPEKTLKVNVRSSENIVKAVLAQPDNEHIKVVYIGSVAQYGDRLPPNHWGMAGDPSYASQYDMYSVSKCVAEKVLADSGIKKWVSLRQTGILYPEILKAVNSTVFHVPLAGVIEWTTLEDAGRVLSNVCDESVPESFWNNFYNISSGADFRMSNYEFLCRMLGALKLPAPEKIFSAEWFALQNFHGMWYKDADELENILHFRENITLDDYFKRMVGELPWYFSLAFLAPAFAIKLFMRKYAYEKKFGTQYWVKHDRKQLEAYYGSYENYQKIKSWDDVRPEPLEKDLAKARACRECVDFEYGYDRSRSIYSLSREEVEAAARFRGGKFVGPAEKLGTKGQIFNWECEHGHVFTASLEYILLGGGWCHECGLDKVPQTTTEKNRFTSQVAFVQPLV